MRFSLVLAALLCFTAWMSMVDATQGPVSNCCLRWSDTRVPINRIVNYTIQTEGACPIKAVIFQTCSGSRLCSNPDSPWGKRAMLKVDKERKKKTIQEKGLNEDGSTSDITPAVSTPSKNKRCRKGGRQQRRRRNR